MKEKKVKLGLGIGALAIVVIAGILVYSLLSSPEAKLASALQQMVEEDVIQTESDFNLALDIDADPELLGIYTDEDQASMDLVMDMMQNIHGTSSVIIDNENKVMEIGSSFGITGDVQGEEIDLQIPFHLYFDEEQNEMGIDLDPYAAFLPEVIDLIAYNVVPNIPDAEESLAMYTNGEDVSDFLANELSSLVVPVIEEGFTGKKLTEPMDFDESLFYDNEEDGKALNIFILEHMFDYLNEHSEDDVVTEENGWIVVNVGEDLLLDAFIYGLEEVEKDSEAKEVYEGFYEGEVATHIEELNDAKEDLENLSFSIEASFLIEQGRIVESKSTMSLSMSQDGVSISLTGDTSSTYSYGDDVEFAFYNAEREELTEADMENIAFELQSVFETYLLENMDYDYYDEDYYEEDFFDYELTDEELEFLEAIENQEVTHEDLGLSEEDMYYMVLEYEFSGFVAEGTSDLYLPED
ncbi:hypothetical protein HXA35_10930 [Bacillus sp. A301a_S52]|nr:hypothetical protein [Bacillus sp. A301a_S52]